MSPDGNTYVSAAITSQCYPPKPTNHCTSVLKFDGQCEPIAHCEHAQADSSVSVQLLVQLINGHSVCVVRGWIQHLSTPQHLQDQEKKRFICLIYPTARTQTQISVLGEALTLSIAMMPPFLSSCRDFS